MWSTLVITVATIGLFLVEKLKTESINKVKYNILAGATRRCPGHYIEIIKCIVRAKVAM